MQREVLVDLDPTGLAEAVGPQAHARGVQYVRQHAVERALWSPSAGALLGTVRGSGGDLYATTARFTCDGRSSRQFEWAELDQAGHLAPLQRVPRCARSAAAGAVRPPPVSRESRCLLLLRR